MTQLQRLLCLQGQRCFFCEQPIPAGEASVEHLAAVSNGGQNGDDNCVVCCKAVNATLGNMSVKEKIRVILRHRGPFICPQPPRPGVIQLHVSSPDQLTDLSTISCSAMTHESMVAEVLHHLSSYVTPKPSRDHSLRQSIAKLLPGKGEDEITSVIATLKSQGHIVVKRKKFSYPLIDRKEHTPVPKKSKQIVDSHKQETNIIEHDQDDDEIPF